MPKPTLPVDVVADVTSGHAEDHNTLHQYIADQTADDIGAIDKTTLNAQTVLIAIINDTPVALTIPEGTMLGRITGGDVAALTASQIKSLLTLLHSEFPDITSDQHHARLHSDLDHSGPNSVDVYKDSSTLVGTEPELQFNKGAKDFSISGSRIVIPLGVVAETVIAADALAGPSQSTEQDILSLVIPANSLVAGVAYEFLLGGTIDGIASAAVTLRWRLGSTTLSSMARTNGAGAQTNRPYIISGTYRCVSIGATGTHHGGMVVRDEFNGGSGGGAKADHSTSVVTVDTTVDQTLRLTAQWGASDANNIFRGLTGSIRRTR